MLIYFHVWRLANSIGPDTVRGAQATYLDASMHRAICDVSTCGIVHAYIYARVCISVGADLRWFRVIIERRYPISDRMRSRARKNSETDIPIFTGNPVMISGQFDTRHGPSTSVQSMGLVSCP